MRVRMLTSVAGTDKDGKVYVREVGEVYEVSAQEGKALCSVPAEMPRAEPVAEKRVQRAEKR